MGMRVGRRALRPGASARGHLIGAPSRSLRLRRGDTFRMAEVGGVGIAITRLPRPIPPARSTACRPLSVAATARVRMEMRAARGGVSVAAKKGTILAAKWPPTL